MKKLTIILGLVFVMLFSMFLMADAIKIAPYSQPLHDIMHWDARSQKLIIQNPENENQTVSWPSTVDLWNYNGNSWTFDLPSGDVFAFSKRVNINTSTTEGAGSTVRSESITHTVGAAGAIHEALWVTLDTEFATGSWANAIVGVLDYGALGSSSGGLGASICAEVNMAPIASPGGSYYNVHSYFNVPLAAALIDSTAFNYAFERYEIAADASHDFDLYGLLWHIVGLDDNTTKVWYDNTLKIQIDTTIWWIPLSEAQGSYTTQYQIISTRVTGASIDLVAPETGIDIGIADHGIHFTGAVTPGDADFSFINVGEYGTALAVAPAGANMFGIMHNVSLTDIDVAYWYQAYYTKITTAGTTTATSVAANAIRMVIGSDLGAVYGVQSHVDISGARTFTSEVTAGSFYLNVGSTTISNAGSRVNALQAVLTGSSTVTCSYFTIASFTAATNASTDALVFIGQSSVCTTDTAVEFDLDGTATNVWEFNGTVPDAFTTADTAAELGAFDEYVLIPVTVEGVGPQLYIIAAETWQSVD